MSLAKHAKSAALWDAAFTFFREGPSKPGTIA
jgi:hypothetical protein